MSSSASDDDSVATKVENVKLKDLIRKRGVQKGKLTTFKNFLSKLNPKSLSTEQLIDIELRVDKMADVFSGFEKYQDKIETLATDADMEQHILERESFENTFYECVSLAKSYLKQVSGSCTPPPCGGHVPEHSESIKYPDIALPSFNGNVTNWIEFRDTFDALINQTSLKPIQKYKYLRSCLKESALEVISSLEYSEESYAIAWHLLCERFNNPKVLVSNHLRALFNIDTVPTAAPALRSFADNISKHLRTLRSLNISTEGWDLLVIFFLSSKLEINLQRKWEEKTNGRELPTLQDFKSFLRAQADLQESLSHVASNPVEPRASSSRKALVTTSSPLQSSFYKVPPKQFRNLCPNCKESHYINQCPRFLALDAKSRIQIVRKLGLCLNCLGSTHQVLNCRASHCKTCKGKHHTLLHMNITRQNTTEPNTQPTQSTLYSERPNTVSENQSINLLTNQNVENTTLGQNNGNLPIQCKSVILSTAQINVLDNNNRTHTMRALLDSGSQSNYISQNAFKKLNLPTNTIDMEVIGFNDNVTKINKLCNLMLQSKDNTYSTQLSCFIVPKICNLPSHVANSQHLNIPKRFKLADESFYQGGEIDIILGAEQFYQLLCIGQHRLGDGLPILQRTRLGWVVSGAVIASQPPAQVRCNFIMNNNLKTFWQSDKGDCPQTHNLPDDDVIQCEKIFTSHTRTSDGNFVVSLPLKDSIECLGQSRPIVYKRFKTLESKFERQPEYKNQYVEFMKEFKNSGHMIEKNNTEPCNYLPHHAVLTPQKTTTPLRVVIDASYKTSTGVSLNDLQYKGKINQDDLMNILLRFRKHKYIVNADIEKMYRMIYINPKQQILQCILWRENPTEPLRTYALTTLSFGLKCAPYIATRCLQQLAYENKVQFPEAAAAISSDFYIDDLLHGHDDEQRLAETAVQVDRILRGANFKLRKWKSNSSSVLAEVSQHHNISSHSNTPTTLGPDTHKVLGLAWCSENDKLMYTLKNEPVPNYLTKRKVLSTASAIFDPLGLLGPVIIIAKLFIQRLWQNKTDWDEKLPNEYTNEWITFYNKLNSLNAMSIPRRVLINECITIELHGFCDSSLTAYGAAIYMRSIDSCGNIIVRLLCSKSRVARKETIPRLELRAALLLTKLYNKVNNALQNNIPKTYFWSDSNVALAWIKSNPNKLICFVKNRVTEIQGLTDTNDWHWVSTNDNPADLLSRGVHADKLMTCSQWWQGPSWLAKPTTEWPSYQQPQSQPIPTIETHCNICTNGQCTKKPNENNFIKNLFQRWSSFKKLSHCFALVLRFIHNCKNSKNKQVGSLTVQELNKATSKLVQLSQIESYPNEYQLLENNKSLPKSSSLLGLNPFMENGLIRVGGRLGLSHFDHNKKHPIILPRQHTLTELIVRNKHVQLLHAGPQLLLSSIRERYWPLHGKSIVNKVVNKCVTCARAKPRSNTPIMGNLPTSRVTPAPPFLTTGVDYAGPFIIRDRRGRGYKTNKSYISIFVCLVTKAVHIELVSGLETAAFLSAYRRFVSRRGKPKAMLSDNGTTFHGANNELTDLYNFLNDNFNDFVTSCADEGIEWKFLPPYTPHMGGLHEAAVRCCKFHLKRVLGQALLTYEEFATVLTQVEGILNSRPLCPIPNSNSDEISYLTPAHFLIGRTPISIPDYDYKDVPTSRLTHYQQLQQLQQDFWRRWSRDYVGLLQERTKWRCSKGQGLSVGTVVLVKEERLPPCRWRLGRIVGCCPGRDGVARVAEIRTAKGIIKRAFNNICPLPIDNINTD